MKFTVQDIAAMSVGAAVMGGGGAGDPYVGEVLLQNLLADGGGIDVISVDELADDDELAPFALVGSPLALSEKLLGTVQLDTLFAGPGLRERLPRAVLPYEVAGLNALFPLAAAAYLGVPCVDADFTGRGVPSLDVTMLEVDRAQPESYLLCDSRGRTVTLNTSGGLSVEQLTRPVVATMGWLAALSTSSLSSAFCRKHALHGTMSRCLDLGRVFLGLPELTEVEARPALASVGGRLIGSGIVADRMEFSDRIGARSTLAIETASDDGPLRVELRNEFHLVVQSGEILAAAPDLIVLADRVDWEPLSAEDVVPGRDVHVIALPIDSRWRSARGLHIGGPRALGYQVDHVPFAGERVEGAR